mmetsp:Transcript_25269/g.77897  ORF Transcript_25269/g.77897 Transcript_25269/m.77897 type:complete len:82 (+) Transcript_25269:3-248(+)
MTNSSAIETQLKNGRMAAGERQEAKTGGQQHERRETKDYDGGLGGDPSGKKAGAAVVRPLGERTPGVNVGAAGLRRVGESS